MGFYLGLPSGALIYGTIAVALTDTELRCLDFVYNSVFVKLFKVKSIENIRLCQYYSGHLPFSYVYELQRYKFLKSIINRELLHSGCKIDESDYRDFQRIHTKFNLSTFDSPRLILCKFWDYFSKSVI